MTGTIPDIDTAPNIGRREIVKSAAWSAPVIMGAAFAPAAAASTPAWDVAVTGQCSTGLLGIVGNSALTFTITAAQGTVPAGTSFTLSSSSLLNVSALAASPNTLVSISVLGSSSALLTLTAPLSQGSSVTIDLMGAGLLTVGLAYTFTLQLNGSDHPANPATAAPNSASVSALVQANLVGIRSLVCL
ncbi:hypothetical protein SPF06_14095 [Sinomonas sp. JGH33]|uniref:Uncharacterized protein n=1 Tax=Sinomonas terricola TaxID=3110330 RepID=A0ABU5T8T9_9MICC|nr:hypothetical protein [Sinomonas sp. JGH33]MEA5455861.1 hypothetical protein [Sinomonas sp. JGH33]